MREGWQTRSLGEVAAWSSGDYLSKANRGAGSVPVFGANGQTGWTEKPNITEGAIAVGRVGACGAIHSVDGPAWITDNALIVRPRENVNLPYLRLTLEAFDFTPLISGSNQPLITQGRVKAATVAIPPIEEQRRIVDLMSHVDDALRSCDALVSAEGALLDAASEALVFSPEFPLMKVGDLAEGKRGLVGGPFGSSLVGRDYVETGVPVIRGQNLQGRYVSGDFVFVSEEKSRSLHGNQATPGDVVFTQRGTLGQVSLIPDDAYPNYVVSQSQMRLTPDRSIVSADWVYHAFRTPWCSASSALTHQRRTRTLTSAFCARWMSPSLQLICKRRCARN